MAPFVDELPALSASQEASQYRSCLMAGTMDWSHRDPFNRFLGASGSAAAPRWSRPTQSSIACLHGSGEASIE